MNIGLKSFLVALSLFSSCGYAAMKDYDKYFSQVIINNFAYGVYNSGGKETQYFCIGIKRGDETLPLNVVCKFDLFGNHKQGFQEMMDIAKYHYATGDRIRVYYKEPVWTDADFVNAFSNGELIALTSCSSDTYCMGPTKKN